VIRAVLLALCFLTAAASPARAAFGFEPGDEGFAVTALEGGEPATLAGSHPYQLRAHISFNATLEAPGEPGVLYPDADLRNLTLQFPAGLLANPEALPVCSLDDFHRDRQSPFEKSASGESCPAGSQVGVVDVRTSSGDRRFGLFNLEPPPGTTAQFGFSPYGAPVAFDADLRPGGDGAYALSLETTNFTQSFELSGLDLELWGTPWAASHDGQRGQCLNEVEPAFPWGKCSVGPPLTNKPRAFLTLPTDCQSPLRFSATATAWQGVASAGASYLPESGGAPLTPTGCNLLRFEPTAFGQLSSTTTTTPTGFAFTLFNQSDALLDPALRVPSPIRRARVSLPGGVTVNPSLGVGLGVCTAAQLAAEDAAAVPVEGCPETAKIGSFKVTSPLFSEPLSGAVFLAAPDDNPFGSLLAVYLVAQSAQRGLLVKLAGRLDPDPQSGTLSAEFEGLPQLPYSELSVEFRAGQRAPLLTPASCGIASTEIEMVPYAGALLAARSSTPSPIGAGIGGGPCPSATPGFAPALSAGSINSNVGSYTPFYLHISRRDSEQEFTSYSAELPKGLTGRLAGVPFCPEDAIAAARTRSGRAEDAAPSCPAASQIGRTISGYGVGAALAYAAGRVYLAGPYHGQPLSIVAIASATVGPFDLGTIVIRSAFEVDHETAQLTIDSSASDRIPHILEGIPLHLRDVRVFIDRPAFTRNPSSCEASRVLSTLTGSGARFADPSDDSTATASNHFQLLNCRTLGFRPRLGIRLRGPARRGAFPSLRASFASRGPRDSNLDSISVTMPHSLFLAQQHIRGICTRVQFAAERCPSDSVYGHAVASTPLFDDPLRGDVYLRSSPRRLPDLVASLHAGAVRIDLEGRIGPAKQGIQVSFEGLPDAPIERFVMTLRGGRHGLLTNSANICRTPPLASVKALGQNNRGALFTTVLRGQCQKQKGTESR
jgi:hypothetical protein